MEINIFKKDVERCIKKCNKEIENRKNGVKGESSLAQLEQTILPELEGILFQIKTNNLPAPSERYLISFANAFTVWGWNMQNPTDLFILLAKLNQNYKTI